MATGRIYVLVLKSDLTALEHALAAEAGMFERGGVKRDSK